MEVARRVACLAVALAALVASIAASADEKAAAPPAKDPPDSWFATGVVKIGGRLQLTSYWSLGSKFRAETILAGHRVVTIVNGETYYGYDDVLAAGVAIKRDPEAIAVDTKRPRPFADEWGQLIRAGGESIGFEMYQGRSTEVFRLTNATGRRTIWVSREEPRVPLRVVTYDRASAREETIDYAGWMRGLLIDDSFFEPSSHVDLLPLPYSEYLRQSRYGPVGTVPLLYRGFLESEWED